VTDRPNALTLICGMRGHMRLAMTMLITMGVLLGFSLVFVSPSSNSYPIIIIDLILIVVFLGLFAVAFWWCTRRAMEA
jgi:hypothetical protein